MCNFLTKLLSIPNRFVNWLTRSTQELSDDNANSRFSSVTLIQILGFALTMIVLKWIASDESQADLLKIGWSFGLLTLLALLLGYALWGVPWIRLQVTESIIKLVFVLNTIALALAMARTGGACSIFGQLIPIQLSGMLILEQQKRKLISTKWYKPIIDASFAIVVWIVFYKYSRGFLKLFGLSEPVGEGISGGWQNIGNAILIVVAMAFNALITTLPISPGFRKFASKFFPEHARVPATE